MHERMKMISHNLLTALSAAAEPPCLSLYQPTHRHHPENQQDPIRFRNLVKQLEQSLLQKHEAPQVATMLEPFRTLADNRDFWNNTLDGLAVFGAPGVFQVFGLQRTVSELAIVADSFHTKPLWRFLQSTDRYQVLALSLDRIRLFEGNRDVLDEIDLAPGVPRNARAAIWNVGSTGSSKSRIRAPRKICCCERAKVPAPTSPSASAWSARAAHLPKPPSRWRNRCARQRPRWRRLLS
jgi:hypothetical protein